MVKKPGRNEFEPQSHHLLICNLDHFLCYTIPQVCQKKECKNIHRGHSTEQMYRWLCLSKSAFLIKFQAECRNSII